MKTKNIILIALLVLLTGMVSCKKDHDIPMGKVFNGESGGSGGGSTTDSSIITVTANPSEGGMVSGGGTYQHGQQCTLTAVANADYSFSNWTEDGIQVSTSANYTFTVDGNRNLVANFSGFGGGTGKTVLIKDFTGARCVNCPAAAEYVHNLQHQLDEDHIFIMSVHAGFQAQPMGSFPNFLTDEGTEWYNNHDSNPLFAVDHVALTDGNTLNEGQIDAPVTESLLEEQSFEILVNPQYDETNRQLQVEVQAIALENLDGQFYITACLVEDHIIGWQTTPGGVDKEYDFRNVFRGTLNGAYGEEFGSSHVNSNDNYNFNYNCEINADFNADECYLIVYVYDKSQGDKILQTAIAKIKQSVFSNFTISVSTNPSNGGTVTGGGTYQQGQSCTVTAVANEGYTFTNWTENGNQVSEDASYTFVMTSNRTLIANFAFVQGEGSGTFEDPYNVVAGIGLQSEEPIAWVHGYIVGAVKSGLSSVTSNADINWSAPFDLATNVVIADDVTCHEISQCIIVNLPAGKPLRTQVNLMDNPGNLGKPLAVNGKLRMYLGQAGLRDSNGTEADFVLEGGDTPPNPGTELFSESFANGQGQFTIQDVFVPQELSYVWHHDSQYSCMKASAYSSGQNYVTESWLVSPFINLSGVGSAKLTFSQAINYASPQGALFIMISTNYNGNVSNATWTELNLDQWPAGNNWTFITSTADLTPYVGQTVTIAFKYTSLTSASATWEVKDFVVE